MSILDSIKHDHDSWKATLKKILKSDVSADRASLFREMGADLLAHSKAEEKVFYQRLKKEEEGKDESLEGVVEHEILARLIEDLNRMRNKTSDEWTARCSVLQEMVEHHVDEEEEDFFKTARKILSSDELDKMGPKFLAEKAKHLDAKPKAVA